jgi:outer membrane murein-binding lipoprotein Lpp
VDAYEVSLAVAFRPPLTIAKQQQAIECLETLAPQQLEVTNDSCSVRLAVQAADSEAARNDAEFAVARALSTAGHTMYTAPITTESVRATTP